MKMQNSDQDQRSSGIEDTSMTIEFLRARLLSERSVSKSTRQRADEMAKRVAELEEQLRIVSLQRKKAEKATADVLAILESHGINDMSDSYYSSSDDEVTPYGHNARGSSTKKAESSGNSREKERDLEKSSGSELEPSPMPGRRLSWKGRRDPSVSAEKFKDSSVRRSSSFTSISSSPKHRLGKSCRQIKRREQRSEAAECADDSSVRANSQKSGGASGVVAEISRADSGGQEEKESFQAAAASSQLGEEFGAERDMQRALEHQAQLIGRYKNMEKEQREWEEKFRENNSSAAESCDPGNQSDITEEREDGKFQSAYCHQRVMPPPQCSKSEIKVPDNGSLETSRGKDEACSRVKAGPASLPLHDPITEQKSTPPVSSDSPGKLEDPVKSSAQGSETSSRRTEPYAVVPHQTSGQVGTLLDTLRRAKLLLQDEISRVQPGGFEPVGFGFDAKATQPSFTDIPGGFPGLFRLPTDFSPEPARGNYPLLDSGSYLAGYFSENGALLTSKDQFSSGRYTVSSPASSPIDDRFLKNQFMDSASTAGPPTPRFGPHLNSVPPSTDATYPQYPSYPDSVPTLPSNGRYFPRQATNPTSAIPPPVSDQFLFRGDINGPKVMYR